jgi:hypothetical protein
LTDDYGHSMAQTQENMEFTPKIATIEFGVIA